MTPPCSRDTWAEGQARGEGQPRPFRHEVHQPTSARIKTGFRCAAKWKQKVYILHQQCKGTVYYTWLQFIFIWCKLLYCTVYNVQYVQCTYCIVYIDPANLELTRHSWVSEFPGCGYFLYSVHCTVLVHTTISVCKHSKPHRRHWMAYNTDCLHKRPDTVFKAVLRSGIHWIHLFWRIRIKI